MNVDFKDIVKAREVVSKYLKPSPLLHNEWLSKRFGCEVYLKLDSLLPIGAFKIRGAVNRVYNFSDAEKKSGAVVASAGNHGQGMAWACREFGVSLSIYMPKFASLRKVRACEKLGAVVVLHGKNFDEAYEEAVRVSKEQGKVFVHPFEHPQIVAGQGTSALEVVDQLEDFDVLIGSIGGGGWMTGCGTVMKELKPHVRVIGVQAEGAPSMVQSLHKGEIVKSEAVSTLADGIAVKNPSPVMMKLLSNVVDDSLTVDDEEISEAILLLMEAANIVAEGSGAAPLAALERIGSRCLGKKVVILVSGGNIDSTLVGRIIDRGLRKIGRRVRFSVVISDRPGSLAKITTVIAQTGASILQVVHDRTDLTSSVEDTEVLFTVETKGPAHSRQVLDAAQKSSYRFTVIE